MRDDEEDADELEFHAFQRRVSAEAPPRVGRARKASDRFVEVPLWWAEQAARATSTPKAFVWIWLLHMAWRAKNSTFTISNEQLRAFGVHRNTKYQALRELERAGLIQVSREGKKAPLVTLLYL
jgi:hypothetical protein